MTHHETERPHKNIPDSISVVQRIGQAFHESPVASPLNTRIESHVYMEHQFSRRLRMDLVRRTFMVDTAGTVWRQPAYKLIARNKQHLYKLRETVKFFASQNCARLVGMNCIIYGLSPHIATSFREFLFHCTKILTDALQTYPRRNM